MTRTLCFLQVLCVLACALVAISPTSAQTPQQMEYERQQREYWRQQEQQRQEQQRQQQIMQENARRQQEESSRLNAPSGQSSGPGYQNSAPQGGGRPPSQQGQSRPQVDATAATAGAEWVPAKGHQAQGVNAYAARSSIRRQGNIVKMWGMFDFASPQVADGQRYLSVKNEMEFDCKNFRARIDSITGYSGHKGSGSVVNRYGSPLNWESISPNGTNPGDALARVACNGS